MRCELLARLSAAPGFGFEDSLARRSVFDELGRLPRDEARATLRAALIHVGLPWYVKIEVAVEVERGRFVELAHSVRALGGEVPGVDFHAEVLEAMAETDACACDVYVRRPQRGGGPRMVAMERATRPEPQVEETRYRCLECGAVLVHRRTHHEPGGVTDAWSRAARAP